MYLSFYLSRLQDTVKHSFFKAVSHGVGKKDVHFLRASITKQLRGLFHECAALNGNISPKKIKK